jgi:hypothetical protein
MERIRCYSQIVPIATHRQPGTAGVGPATEAGAAVQGTCGAETKTVT